MLVVGGQEEHVGDAFTDIGVSQQGGRWLVTYPGDSHRIIALGRSQWAPSSTKRPNHAMQRTAGRSAFPLSVISIFNLQPRALSPAVADLGSR